MAHWNLTQVVSNWELGIGNWELGIGELGIGELGMVNFFSLLALYLYCN
ncbi:hypothetical protein [Microcoleus sp.]